MKVIEEHKDLIYSILFAVIALCLNHIFQNDAHQNQIPTTTKINSSSILPDFEKLKDNL